MLYQLSYLGIEGQAWGYRGPVSACPEGHFCGAAHRNWRHSTLIPASLMMTPHLSISALRYTRSSSGDDPITPTPSCSSRVLIVGSASAATVSACSFWITAGGVRAGTNSAYHADT